MHAATTNATADSTARDPARDVASDVRPQTQSRKLRPSQSVDKLRAAVAAASAPEAAPCDFEAAAVARRAIQTPASALRTTITAAQAVAHEVASADPENLPFLSTEQALSRLYNSVGLDLTSAHFRRRSATEASHSFFRQALKQLPEDQREGPFAKSVISNLAAANGSKHASADLVAHTVHAMKRLREADSERFRIAVESGVVDEKRRLEGARQLLGEQLRAEFCADLAAKEDALRRRAAEAASLARALEDAEALAWAHSQARAQADARVAALSGAQRELEELRSSLQHSQASAGAAAEEAKRAARDLTESEAGRAAAEAARTAAEATLGTLEAALATEVAAREKAEVASAAERSARGNAEAAHSTATACIAQVRIHSRAQRGSSPPAAEPPASSCLSPATSCLTPPLPSHPSRA